ncbi:MAG: ribonuclease E/G [Proteobacteria bacterium]|nr:ribonuclease E/G [Pseudomonadota bacterium]
MSKTMLIDTAHAEETRVVVVDGQRIEEFDFESQSRKQLRGNIYLAKVVRVEPSLQAAFVEYGGGRHGFLAFNEIHPDYYQIPSADREALLREEAEENARISKNGQGSRSAVREVDGEAEADSEFGGAAEIEDASSATEEDEGDADILEAAARQRRRLMRRYKIQEVIKRRQILLVQVVKEERGNKGAALTTYMSLAGRYGVLMPNTAKGGGISRKIESATDRKRLKTIVSSLEVPQGMGLIIRTAGASRTKAEIKRDYDYLLRLWESIREVTLQSIAPALIYEEEDLVKRAVRDMYDKEYEGIYVEGEEGYKEARDFMRMLMPSQVKKVMLHKEPLPLFVRHKVEDQLSQIHSPVVPLRSGGYLVINQTEALVAIDVNSGKSTRERGIEATALKTNLEAADEAARQLRLRDLAGLIVIDFIDMDESKNNRAVEKRLKDALDGDRARLQMGKISPFGLMEISRQRRRTGVLEGTTHVCPSCQGLGRIRSAESSALSALRAVEIEVARDGGGEVVLRVPTAVALYILNEKRAYLTRLEQIQGLRVIVITDDGLGHADHAIERMSSTGPAPQVDERAALAPSVHPARVEVVEEGGDDELDEEEEDEAEETAPTSARESEEDARGRRGRRRRGGRRRGGEERPELQARPAEVEGDHASVLAGEETDEEGRERRRRRGRRGGRRTREEIRTGTDPYSWTRARSPDGADPYAWFDPLPQIAVEAPEPAPLEGSAPELTEARLAANDPEPQVGAVQIDPGAAEAQAAVPAADETPEAPAGAEPDAKPKRVRAPRKPRARKGAAEELAAPQAPAADAGAAGETPVSANDDLAGPVQPAAVEAPQPELQAEPAAAALLEPEPEPAAPALPDPAEISAPPATPRRGWWRRGA